MLKVCRKCGRVFARGRWRKHRGNEVARAELMGEVEYTICPDCLRDAEAHAAVLQVRGRFEREEVERIILEELEKNERKGGAERVFEKKGDYYFTSKSMARAVAKRLKEMGAEIKESTKIHTFDRERSVPVTRLTIAARFRVKAGDVVSHGGELYLVEKVRGSWVWTASGKKLRIKDVEVVPSESFEGIIVSRIPPMVFIPGTGETVEVERVPEVSEVKVVVAGDKRWVIPAEDR